MDELEVVNGKPQIKAISVDFTFVKTKLADAQNNLNQALDAKSKSTSEQDATIAYWTKKVDELNRILGQIDVPNQDAAQVGK